MPNIKEMRANIKAQKETDSNAVHIYPIQTSFINTKYSINRTGIAVTATHIFSMDSSKEQSSS